MRSASWTGENIALLKELWAAGETAHAIGARLGGMSRSAVLGKVYRLRLDAAEKGLGAPVKQSPAAGRSKRVTALPRRRRSKKDEQLRAPPKTRRQHKTLLELTNETCRWPHGRPGSAKFFFCGAAGADLEHGIPYCARHMRRAYQTENSAFAKVSEATA